uniref:Oligopeptide transporter 1 n=1 Tax=Haemonchus contortus TaxID=6289 RepID=A0A7I4Z3T0_HAECO
MVDEKRLCVEGIEMQQGITLPHVKTTKTHTSWGDMLRHWPKTTFCIVSNEFCERFSYYGMRTVLILYLLNVLKFTESQSTIFFNSFTVLCYMTPLLGSIIADGYIGKFWTIFFVSILYACGQVILAVASINNKESSIHPWMDLAGLIIIGFGTGGIKPCVSAFGGDQFEIGQERMLSLFFSMFYFSINAGSMISTFISPIFRSQPCLGQDSCYPLAFGVPAVLMILATCLFMAGSFWYKKPPPKENIFAEVSRAMVQAFINKYRSKDKEEHWLDHYLDTHMCESDPKCLDYQVEIGNKNVCQKKSFINDIKSLLRVLIMFLPVPMFWALYDQQGSIWLIQGIQMDCRLSSTMLLLPDQMQTLNAVLILLFIPLFETIVYPLTSKCFIITPLRKMVVGGLLASLSFLVTGLVQLSVNKTLPTLPASDEAYVSMWNQLDTCSVVVTFPNLDQYTIKANVSMIDSRKTKETSIHIKAPSTKATAWTVPITLEYKGCTPDKYQNLPRKFDVQLISGIFFVAISPNGVYQGKADPSKPTQGTGEFSLGIVSATSPVYNGNLAMCRMDAGDFDPMHPCNPRSPSDFYYWETNYDDGTDDRAIRIPDNSSTVSKESQNNMPCELINSSPVKPGRWHLYYLDDTPKNIGFKTPPKSNITVKSTGIGMEIHEQGAVYVLALTGSMDKPAKHINQVVPSNSVSILLANSSKSSSLLQQKFFFLLLGYEFAYSQSAPSMKALVQALWLLTTAVGDSIIVLITALNLFSNMATEFFAYAGAMFVVIFVFALMSIFYYEYNFYTNENFDILSVDDKAESVRDPSNSIANRMRSFSLGHHDEEYAWEVESRLDDHTADERF